MSDEPLTQPLDEIHAALCDRYLLERELGRGGMASVYLAQDLKHGRHVAIKILRPEIAAAVGHERFQREIEIAARLQHPHILPLYDSGAAGRHLFYVMPLVEGESLRDRLDREHQLPMEDVVRIAREVGSALAYAHGHGIVHRDIKPGNILLSGDAAVVADFGIARALSSAGEQLTQTGMVIGTPEYMSPEQGTGSVEIDGRSDQYSLACVVYEMLAGMPPFTGPSAHAIIARHSLDAVSRPSIVRASISDSMERALLRGLAKAPADRFPSIAAFVEALARPGADARPVAAPPRPDAAPRSNRRRWLLGAVLPLALSGVALAIWLAGRRSGAGSTPERDPRRIAVLYFQDRSPDHSLEYLADGVTEALIRAMADVPVLHMISRNGVAPYRGHAVPTDSIARALEVGTVVDGSVAPLPGDSLRVEVELVNANSNELIGSSEFRAPRAEVLALQDSLAGHVSAFLRLRLGREVQALVARRGTRSAAAWGLTQEAEEFVRQVDTLAAAGDTSAAARGVMRADSLLDSAAVLDPKWIIPWIRRGWLTTKTARIAGLDRLVGADWTRRGLGFAERALALDPGNAQALTLRGVLRLFRWMLNLEPVNVNSDRQLEAAEQDLRAGTVRSNPDRALAYYYLSFLLARKSQTADAKLAALGAYEADPYLANADGVLWRLFTSSLDMEDGVEAAKWCLEGYRRFPRDPVFTECQIELYALPGQRPDIDRAWRLLEQNVALYPPNRRANRRPRGEILVAMAIARAGLLDSADAVARRARTDDPAIDPTHEFPYLEMLLRCVMGDMDGAIDRLKLYLAYNPQDRSTIAADQSWWLKDLRRDPRFERVLDLAP